MGVIALLLLADFERNQLEQCRRIVVVYHRKMDGIKEYRGVEGLLKRKGKGFGLDRYTVRVKEQ